jgi:Sulfotransferase domain
MRNFNDSEGVRCKREMRSIRRVLTIGFVANAILVATVLNLRRSFLPQQSKRYLQNQTDELDVHPVDAVKRKPRIPSILLAGAQKASTSSLAVYLMKMNQTCFSDVDEGEKGGHGKEAHFFDVKYQGLDYFQYLYRKCSDEAILIDATPETMMHPLRVRRTYDEAGTADDLKIIFILREPISRSISWYNHQLRQSELPDRPQWTDLLFDEQGQLLSYIEVQRATVVKNFENEQWHRLYGYYAHWLNQWSLLFDRRTQILLLSYDELIRDPATLLSRVHQFLNLTQDTSLKLTRENANRKNTPPPPCTDQLEMAEYFVDPNEELYAFLDENPGPPMEQRPFPKFELECKPIPLVLFAGAPMSGISSIASHFWFHKTSCFSDAQSYEGSVEGHPHFFDEPDQYKQGLKRYQQMYEHCDSGSLMIDASPGAMAHPEKAKQIYDEQGAADQLRTIFILRDPVSRQLAIYNEMRHQVQNYGPPNWTEPILYENGTMRSFMQVQRDTIVRDFQSGRGYTLYGNYVHWLRLWISYFDRKQILVLSYDELINDPYTGLRRIYEFLDITFHSDDDFNIAEERHVQGQSPPPCSDMIELSDYFVGPNRALYEFLEENPGPEAEQQPFPRFQLPCPTDSPWEGNITM